jgi:hypothetical protein
MFQQSLLNVFSMTDVILAVLEALKDVEGIHEVVDARGVEPLTSSVSGKRSKPTELSVRKTNALHMQGV